MASNYQRENENVWNNNRNIIAAKNDGMRIGKIMKNSIIVMIINEENMAWREAVRQRQRRYKQDKRDN